MTYLNVTRHNPSIYYKYIGYIGLIYIEFNLKSTSNHSEINSKHACMERWAYPHILGAQFNAYHASALNIQHGIKTVVVVDDDASIEPHHHNRTISESTTTTKELTKGQTTYRKAYGTFSLLRSRPFRRVAMQKAAESHSQESARKLRETIAEVVINGQRLS